MEESPLAMIAMALAAAFDNTDAPSTPARSSPPSIDCRKTEGVGPPDCREFEAVFLEQAFVDRDHRGDAIRRRGAADSTGVCALAQ